jgi:hypothetical protein
MLGGVWLLVGCYLTVVAGDLLGLQRRLVVLAILLAVGTPALLHATTIINPDATAFAAGAGVLLAALAWERRRVGLWALALAALIAVVLKVPNLVGIVIVIAFFIGRAISNRLSMGEEGLRQVEDYAKAVAVLVVGAVVAIEGSSYLLSFLYHHVIGKPDTNPFANADALGVINLYRVHGLSLDRVFGVGVVPQLLPPIIDVAPPVARQGGIYDTFVTLARYLLIVPVVGLLLVGRRLKRELQLLTVGALAALLVTPVLLVLYWYFADGTNDQIPPRYGLSAMPVLVLLLAAAAGRGRVGPWVLGLIAVAMYLSALLTNVV